MKKKNKLNINNKEDDNKMFDNMFEKLKDNYIFVDIDGTLAEYRFNNHVSAKDGTTNGQTLEEIKNHIFLKSRPLKSIINILSMVSKRKEDKNIGGIYICGAIISPIELLDKIEWLKMNCKDIQFNNNFWFVPTEYWNDFKKYFELENNKLKFNILEIADNQFNTSYGLIIKGSKIQIWDYIKNNNLLNLNNIVFIDDVLSYLKFAEEKGVTSYHISSFID